jgi:hypothetical protein
MSLANAAENALLLLLFQNTNYANVGDATGLRGSTTVGSFHMSGHTADPGEAGDQTTSEIGYTSYARAAIPRTSGGFTVSTNTVSLASACNFPAGTGGSGTMSNWGLGTASSGAGSLLLKGSISPSIVCGTGVTPQLAAGTVVTLD